MKKKAKFIAPVYLALAFVMLFSPLCFASESVPDLTLPCSLTVIMKNSAGNILPGGRIVIYKVADWVFSDGKYAWKYTSDYSASYGENVTNLTNDSALSLARFAQSRSLSGKASDIDEDGKAFINDISPALYIVVQTKSTSYGKYRTFSPFFLSLPLLSESEDSYSYNVTAYPKVSAYHSGGSSPSPSEDTESDSPIKENDEIIPDDTKDVDLDNDISHNPESEHNDTPVSEHNTNDPVLSHAPDTVCEEMLPYTGQLWWPVPVFTVFGLFFSAFGIVLIRRGRRE